ncbi:MAG TPA: right-handed parallel beta-helix repeat-containing protein [Oligoflexia bacterium]|mgnify:CR=1 FL=1|nr:right-handed parallel beta-helix repeat-containing protein [Oligoflexia bacterium]HMP48027.1 right-handed parallel beta-helix repeat-containing protein [Oligoflexia bacterium]
MTQTRLGRLLYYSFLLHLSLFSTKANSQNLESTTYNIGSPTIQEIWVDPILGNNSNSGQNRNTALKTITAAWQQVPQATPLTSTGYRIMLVAGDYPEDSIPNYWEKRYGSAEFPIILQSADGRELAKLRGDINAFDIKYLYLIDVDIMPNPPGDAFHCEKCDHLLMRGMELSGGNREAHETIKINQSQHIFIEDSEIHGAGDNAIDFVAVQYGHVLRSKIHNAEDWCFYAKGGSAYLNIEGNTIYNCGTGGFTAGQGTGLEFMTSPWLHYEAYDIKFTNNIIHDTEGAGFGVNGGYNILLAFNTLYKVGSRSHLIEVVHGLRSCDGNAAGCTTHIAAGAWGTGTVGEEIFIGNNNILIYNNIVYNPTGFESGDAHFSIHAPRGFPSGSGPTPAVADSNVQIKGNIIFNGQVGKPLGIDESTGCRSTNTSCNPNQLQADNSINIFEPSLINPESGNFRPTTAGNVYSYQGFPVPGFLGGDRISPPLAPEGVLINNITRDHTAQSRTENTPVGAFSAPLRGRETASAYLPWNGFLGMINILELINADTSAVSVKVTLFNISGEPVGQVNTSIESNGQIDIIINEIPGFSSTSYGLIVLDFESSRISAKVSFYRPSSDGTEFDFAYTVPWKGGINGTTYVGFNTFQPSRNLADRATSVTNWLSIINQDGSSAHSFTVKYYNIEGILFREENIQVPPFARMDLEAGHVIPGPDKVGLLEIIPDTPDKTYSAMLIRYGEKSGSGNAYSFAFPLFAIRSPGLTQVLPISTGGSAQNWVEVLNTTSEQVIASLQFYNQEGVLFNESPIQISVPGRAQAHFNATSYLGLGAIGKVAISSSEASLISQSMFYFYDNLQSIATMYGSQAKDTSDTILSGSYNLYLGMFNWLKLLNMTGSLQEINLQVNSATGVINKSYQLPANGSIDLGLHERENFGTRPDTYGAIKVTGNNIYSEVLRIRPSRHGGFDYAFSTPVE